MHALSPAISDSAISIHIRVWFFIQIPLSLVTCQRWMSLQHAGRQFHTGSVIRRRQIGPELVRQEHALMGLMAATPR
jgi:hypothetical protein